MSTMRVLLRPKLVALPDPVASPAEWEQFVRRRSVQWGQLIKAFLKVAAERPEEYRAVASRARGLADGDESASDSEYLCWRCGETWVTMRSLKLHVLHKHGVRSDMRTFVAGSACPVCLRDFGTRPRVVHHLTYAASHCRLVVLRGDVPRQSAEVIEAADAKDQVLPRHLARLGVSELSGAAALVQRDL